MYFYHKFLKKFSSTADVDVVEVDDGMVIKVLVRVGTIFSDNIFLQQEEYIKKGMFDRAIHIRFLVFM